MYMVNITSTAVPAQSVFVSVMYGLYTVITPAIFVIVIVILLLYVVMCTLYQQTDYKSVIYHDKSFEVKGKYETFGMNIWSVCAKRMIQKRFYFPYKSFESMKDMDVYQHLLKSLTLWLKSALQFLCFTNLKVFIAI